MPIGNPFFTGRAEIFTRLEDRLKPGSRVALTGMPGVGKTATAIEFAHRHRADFRAVLWATADTQDNLASSYAAIAEVVGLEEAEQRNHNAVVAAVKRWLQTKTGWLLILDNADNLPDIRDVLPSGGQGVTLITTRPPATGTLAKAIDIPKMSVEDGARLLLLRSKRLDNSRNLDQAITEDREAALDICSEFDGLPLALDQAGAYIEEASVSPAEYLALYQTEGKRLRNRGSTHADADKRTVFLTFSLAFQMVERTNRAAADLLRLCAFLAPDSIPEDILIKGGPELGDLLASIAGNTVDRLEMIAVTTRCALLRRDPDAKTLSIHRLVQEVIKDTMDEQTNRMWVKRTAMALYRAFPNPDYAHWQTCEKLLPHVRICAQAINLYGLEFVSAAPLLKKAAWYLSHRAQFAEAENLYLQALSIANRVVAADNPLIDSILNNLGTLYTHTGQYDKAEQYHLEALAVRKKVFGPLHPKVATSLDNLASVYALRGHLAAAEAIYRQALEIREATLACDDLGIAYTLSNLATTCADQGRGQEALLLHARALEIRQKHFAVGPELADSYHNMAAVYHSFGQFPEAETSYKLALSMLEQTVGANHPNVATTCQLYGKLLHDTHREDEAQKMEARAAAIRARNANHLPMQ